jgi:cell division protein FtsW
MGFFSKIFRGDRVIWAVFLFLCIISIIEVYSASSTLTFTIDYYWWPILKHVAYLFAGACVVMTVAILPLKFIRYIMLGLPVVWILLLLVMKFGSSVNGAQRTIFFIQPSELAKVCLICATAFLLSIYHNYKKEIFYRILLVCVGITCGLILGDNLSTAVILFAVVFMMLIIGQIPAKKLIKIGGIVFIIGVTFMALWWIIPDSVWSMNRRTQRVTTFKARVERFFVKTDPAEKERMLFDDDHRQVTISKIAIARSGGIGVFPGNSQMCDFLPQAYSDFIYAIILEETGLAGGIFVLILYVILFIRAGIIASRCRLLFPKLLVMGCAMMILVQALANIAVAVGIAPVTGQPLPLISRGGNSIVITCVLIGIILSVGYHETQQGIAEEERINKEFEEEKNDKTSENNH